MIALRKIGIIGGTGVEDASAFGKLAPLTVETPFGQARCLKGTAAGHEIYFLARHGLDHSVPPHKINYRANIFALKKLGVTEILSFTAVGSLNRGLPPGTFVVTSQLLDFTKSRVNTFFNGENGQVAHVDFAQPYCPALRERLNRCLVKLGLRHSKQGTYVVTEGPRYETAAEVRMYAAMGGDVAGMTNMPESVLAREAEICYANCSVVTNMGSGLAVRALSHEEVTEAMERLEKQILAVIEAYVNDDGPLTHSCQCREALKEYGGFRLEAFGGDAKEE